MKKIIILGFLALSFLIPHKVQAKTLYDCFTSKKLSWNWSERAKIAAENGIFFYKGTAKENTALSNYLCNDKIGFSVATGYSKTLSASITASQSFIPVTSLALKDGTLLSMDNLGQAVFLDIEPGSSKEEIDMCTTINSSTVQFTNCTRGLAFSGTSTAAVAGNQKPHNAGSTIVMSNVHYVYEQFVDVNNKLQTIQGDRTVTGTWTFSNGKIQLSSSTFGFQVNGNNITWSNDGFVTLYNLVTSTASALTASTSQGISIVNSQVLAIVSTTQSMTFGADGRLYSAVSTTRELVNSSTGTFINTTTLVNEIATSTPTSVKIPIADSAGTLNSWVPAATTSLPFTVNTLTGNSWFTYPITMIPNLTPAAAAGRSNGWLNMDANGTTADVTTKIGDIASTTFGATQAYTMNLIGTSSAFALLGDQKRTIIQFRFRVQAGGSGNETEIGITNTGNGLDQTTSTLNPRSAFVFTGVSAGVAPTFSIYSDNGVTATTNLISGINTQAWNTGRMVVSSTAIDFFVNGNKVASHTTVPNTNTMKFGFGGLNTSMSVNISDPIISQEF